MNRLFVEVEEVTPIMAAGYTLIRVYTDTAEDGTFVTLDGTATLVADQDTYEYTDLDGTSATWYRTAYWGAGPGESDMSPARRGETRRAYATVKEFRADVGKTDDDDDLTIARLLDAAGAAIDRFCNRPDGFMAEPNATTRYYPGSGGSYQWIDECVAVTAVAVKDSPSDDEDAYVAWVLGTVGTTTDADVFPATGNPSNPDYQTLPYTMLMIGANGDYSRFTTGAYTHRPGFRPERTAVPRGLPTVEVTARWGFASAVPQNIATACLMQAARWYKRLQSSMADVLASGELGQLMYRQKLDPEVALLLEQGRYVRPATGRY